MEKADGLSRRLDWKVGVDKDNDNQTLIKDNWICSLEEVVIKGPKVEIVKKIKNSRGKDKEIVRTVEEMKKTKVKELQEDEWKIKRELVLKEGKVYMLKDEELKAEVIWLHYDMLAARHGRKQKTMELVTRNYQQLGVTRDVGKYVEGCDMCQRIKNRTEEIAGKLKLSEVLEKLQTYIIMDFIMKLPIVAGKNAILVVYNRLSKIMHFVATTEGMIVEGLARLFRDNMQKLHRLLESVVSNRGPQFVAEQTYYYS